MASIAILGCGNVGFYIAAHLIRNNYHAFNSPHNNNNIICVGRQRFLDELTSSKKLTLTKLNSFTEANLINKEEDEDVVIKEENDVLKEHDEINEIIVSKEEIVYETDLKKLIEFNPDYIIVTLKSTQTYDVFKELRDLNGKTTIISIQNGLHNAEIIQQFLPNNTIIRGLINNIAITHKSDSSCHFIQYSSSSGSIILESTSNTLEFQKILQQSELPSTISSDVKSLMYSKLLVNLNTSLFAISGLSYNEYLQNNKFKEIYKKCVSEGLNVFGLLKGITIKINDNLLMEKFVKYLGYAPKWVNKLALEQFLVMKGQQDINFSVAHDFEFARKTEIEFFQGEIVKLGESIKGNVRDEGDVQFDGGKGQIVDVKYNRGILNLIKMIEDRMRESKEGWGEKIRDEEITKYIETGEVPKALRINILYN